MYFLYILYVLPGLFYEGFLFYIMEAFKPSTTIFMLYVPIIFENLLGFTGFDTAAATIPYFLLELGLTAIPQTAYLGSFGLGV
jgi:hypothetical protein